MRHWELHLLEQEAFACRPRPDTSLLFLQVLMIGHDHARSIAEGGNWSGAADSHWSRWEPSVSSPVADTYGLLSAKVTRLHSFLVLSASLYYKYDGVAVGSAKYRWDGRRRWRSIVQIVVQVCLECVWGNLYIFRVLTRHGMCWVI